MKPDTRAAESALWLAASVIFTFLASLTVGDSQAHRLAWLAFLSLAYGFRVFIGHGGGRVTTLGLFNLSMALFVGYAGIVNAGHPEFSATRGWLIAAVELSFSTQVFVTHWAWPRGHADAAPAILPRLESSRAIGLGVIGFFACLAAARAGHDTGQSGYFVDGGAFASVVLLAVGVTFRQKARVASLGMLAVAASFFGYVTLIHGDTGRLRMVALGCALALLVTTRWPSRWWKWGVTAATPAGLWFLAQQRLAVQASHGAAPGSGLESVTSTIAVLARLMRAQADGFPLAWGRNFLSVPFIAVPHAMRPHWAPQPLGYELVRVVAPSDYGTGYSVAGTDFAEWVFNFGLLGFLVAIPVLVWALGLIDRRYRAAVTNLRPGRSVLGLLLWTFLAASIADLAWSGFHTLVARTIARLPLLLVLCLLVADARASEKPGHRRIKAR